MQVMWIACLLTLLLESSTAFREVSSPAYQALPARKKADRVWSNCVKDESSFSWPPPSTLLTKLLTKPVCPSFRTPGDEMPKDRLKNIHAAQGVVGRVQWKNLGGHSYSGIFEGAQHGLARLSHAREPDTAKLNTNPGIGLKFLRDGVDSANLVAMVSLEGQESWNFFKNDMSTHMPPMKIPAKSIFQEILDGPTTLLHKVGEFKFSRATRNSNQVGISDWAKFGENGVEIKNPNFPYRLRFHPTGKIGFSDSYVRPLTEDLVTIPAGSVLFQVFALDKPEQLGGRETRIADLVLKSKLTTSKWGDQHLFFRHQDMAEDLRQHPQWNQFTLQWGLFKKSPNRPSPCSPKKKPWWQFW